MKKLYILRHAKSSWDAMDLPDHDRPLAPRGERAALVMGRYMAQRDLIPDMVICSTATRSVETLRLVASQWECDVPAVRDRSLYLTGARTIRQRVAQTEEPVKVILVIGHNPDLHDLTVELAEPGSQAHRRLAETKFPTSALAVFHFTISDWPSLRSASGTLVDLKTPKVLV